MIFALSALTSCGNDIRNENISAESYTIVNSEELILDASYVSIDEESIPTLLRDPDVMPHSSKVTPKQVASADIISSTNAKRIENLELYPVITKTTSGYARVVYFDVVLHSIQPEVAYFKGRIPYDPFPELHAGMTRKEVVSIMGNPYTADKDHVIYLNRGKLVYLHYSELNIVTEMQSL